MFNPILGSLKVAAERGVIFAIQLAIWSPIAYFAFRKLRTLSTAGRWWLVKVVLIVLFLPFVIVWKVTTAGSDCSCCCDEDD
jgi:hypothetical protein